MLLIIESFYALFVLGLIVPAIIAVVYFLKRITNGSYSKKTNQPIVVTYQMNIGSKERLVCVDIDGTKLLLGITPYSISTLHLFVTKD